MRRPVISLVLATAVLLAMAAPVLGLRSGEAGVSTLPDRLAAKQGYLALNAEFPGETTEPVEIVIDGDAASPAVQDRDRAPARAAGRRGPRFGRARAGDQPGRRSHRPDRPDRRRSARRRRRSTRSASCASEHVPARLPGSRGRGARGRRHRGVDRRVRHDEPLASDRPRVRARTQLRAADDRLPLARRRGQGDRGQPAVGRRRLRAAGARLPGRRRQRALRLPAGRHDRSLGAAVPVRGPLRALDGLPRVPAQPHPRALSARPATTATRSPTASARPAASSPAPP